MNEISMKINADELIRLALKEDVTSGDISTDAVLKEFKEGTVDLICKQDALAPMLDGMKRRKLGEVIARLKKI